MQNHFSSKSRISRHRQLHLGDSNAVLSRWRRVPEPEPLVDADIGVSMTSRFTEGFIGGIGHLFLALSLSLFRYLCPSLSPSP